jgi:hypothetical protein
MNIKTSIIALSIASTSLFTYQVEAGENAANQILTNMVKQAVTSASNEIEIQVDKSLLTASHMLSINGNQVLGTVSITDINTVEAIKNKTKVNSKVKKQKINNIK